ncbi:hypothetical protein BDN71DRAFT_1433208 [Pleurotus eryngii]|uniref:Uncharacterized protein n=1 Tax=Pleurotus eryngii TaxID=5323 RepID=A0A9P6D630_PLEER|nr:hypothetical protein BDN71DRAFT_1433208 [Pleurotus eryngii]
MFQNIVYNAKSKNSPHWTSSAGRRFLRQADVFQNRPTFSAIQKLAISDVRCRPTFSVTGRRFLKQADVFHNWPMSSAVQKLATSDVRCRPTFSKTGRSFKPADVFRDRPMFSKLGRCFPLYIIPSSKTRHIGRLVQADVFRDRPMFSAGHAHYLLAESMHPLRKTSDCFGKRRPAPDI